MIFKEALHIFKFYLEIYSHQYNNNNINRSNNNIAVVFCIGFPFILSFILMYISNIILSYLLKLLLLNISLSFSLTFDYVLISLSHLGKIAPVKNIIQHIFFLLIGCNNLYFLKVVFSPQVKHVTIYSIFLPISIRHTDMSTWNWRNVAKAKSTNVFKNYIDKMFHDHIYCINLQL